MYWKPYQSAAKARESLELFRRRYNQIRPHWALVPTDGGDVLTLADVYVPGQAIQLPKWQGWAKAAREKLKEFAQGARSPEMGSAHRGSLRSLDASEHPHTIGRFQLISEPRQMSNRVRFWTLHHLARAPWRAVLGIARSRGCDLIVMGSHGRGSARAVLLSSQTVRVLAHSKIPVLVCR